ncbi:MAG TPA: tetratricopeptide repeat protein [Kofleriaceae bacterium]|nr:tetratricopeptide repeat protein [Kofleriaceae bacterium]
MKWQMALCVVAAIAIAAAPDARADVLVLDTCVIECDDDDRRLLGAFRRMAASRFKRPGLAINPSDVLEAIGDGVPWPAVMDPGMTSREIIEDLKLGIEHWINGRYEQAATQLEEGLGSARLHPGLVASDAILRQLIPRAHVARAVSLWRLGRRAAAKDAIAELVRTLPEQSILDSWGTEADKIFQLARKELEALGKGALVVEVDDPSTLFYINEAGQPHRSMFAAVLHPGTYQVLVQDATGKSRRFLATVRPNGTAMLRIRWRRDTRFSSSGDRVGFVFESAAERVNEGDHARHFASLANSDLVVVIGRARWRKRPVMVGTIYSVSSGSAYRVGAVPIAGDEPDAMRELATFLFSPSEPAPSVIALAAPPWEAPAPEATSPWLGIQYPLGWALSGGAIAAGATLIATGSDGAPGGYARYTLVGVGLIGGLVTTVFYLHRGNAKSPAGATAMVVPTRTGLFAGVGWRF